MAAAPQALSAPASAGAAAPNPNKRKRPSKGKGNKNKKKKLARSDEPLRRRSNKPSAKFLKILRKRARDYNSDDDEDGQLQQQQEDPPSPRRRHHDDHEDEALSEEEEEEASSSGDESGGASGVTRFEQGCRAFRVAFLKIMAKKLPDDPLGPILSAHKKLVAAKLAEEVEEHKPKGMARKDKRAAAEKGHVLPKDHLDSKEKELIKVATQGVVRLFNAVRTLILSQSQSTCRFAVTFLCCSELSCQGGRECCSCLFNKENSSVQCANTSSLIHLPNK
uniref:Rrp15p n=1 Tax=Arundo donax TaxID=35708 RepID=A0A0A9DBG2_ARUDO